MNQYMIMLTVLSDPNPNELAFTDPPARNNDVVPARLIFTPSFFAAWTKEDEIG